MSRIRMSKEARKQEIRKISLNLFLEKGFKNTTMSDIVSNSNLSKGGIYYHYSSTNEILVDILLIDSSNFRLNLVKSYIKSNKSIDKKELLLNLLLEKIVDKNDYKSLYAMFLSEIKGNDELKQVYKKLGKKTNIEFLKKISELNLGEFELITNEEFKFFINSIYMGMHYLDDFKDNENKIRNMLKIMTKAYFDNCLEGNNEK